MLKYLIVIPQYLTSSNRVTLTEIKDVLFQLGISKIAVFTFNMKDDNGVTFQGDMSPIQEKMLLAFFKSLDADTPIMFKKEYIDFSFLNHSKTNLDIAEIQRLSLQLIDALDGRIEIGIGTDQLEYKAKARVAISQHIKNVLDSWAEAKK